MGDFSYQVGAVITTKPWSKLTYEKARSFLLDPRVVAIIEKYDTCVFGGFLYDKPTWDLDLLLVYDYNESTDWYLIENEFNTLNRIALDEYDILPDITLRKHITILPSKQTVIEDNIGLDISEWVVNRTEDDDCRMIKTMHVKKMSNGKVLLEVDPLGTYRKLTQGYLYELIMPGRVHNRKILKRILQLKDDYVPRLNLPVNEFLSMTKEDYINSLIPTFETFNQYGV